jgi:hypothetical protein
MTRLKVKGYENLVRDVKTSAIINSNKSEYKIYMNRIKAREERSDDIRSAVKEINNLKAELREIKDLLKGIKK